MLRRLIAAVLILAFARGAVAQDKPYPPSVAGALISINAYGVYANASGTDQSAAINRAIAQAGAAGLGLYFPPSQYCYTITSELNLTNANQPMLGGGGGSTCLQQNTYGLGYFHATASGGSIKGFYFSNTQSRTAISGGYQGFTAGVRSSAVLLDGVSNFTVEDNWSYNLNQLVWARGGAETSNTTTSACASSCTSLVLNPQDQKPDNYYNNYALRIADSSGNGITDWINVTGYTNSTNTVTFTAQSSLTTTGIYYLIEQTIKSTGNIVKNNRIDLANAGILVANQDQMHIDDIYGGAIIAIDASAPGHVVYITDAGPSSSQLRTTNLSGSNWNCASDLLIAPSLTSGSCFKVRSTDGASVNGINANFARYGLEIESSTNSVFTAVAAHNIGDPNNTSAVLNAAGIVSQGNQNVTVNGIDYSTNPTYTNNEGTGGNSIRRPAIIVDQAFTSGSLVSPSSGNNYLNSVGTFTGALTGSSVLGFVGRSGTPFQNSASISVRGMTLHDPGAATIGAIVRPEAATLFSANDLSSDVAPSAVAIFDAPGSGTTVQQSYVDFRSSLVAGATTITDSSTETGSSANLTVIDGTLNCGPWTPAVNPVTPGDWSVASVTATGTCYRNGNQVYVQFNYAATPTFTTASGGLTISGFPFKAANIVSPAGLIAINLNSGITWPSSATMANINMVQNSATANLIAFKSATNTVAVGVTGLVSGTPFTIRASGVYATSDAM